MKITWKMVAAKLSRVLGIAGWLYVGVWLVIAKPLRWLIMAYLEGTLTIGQICVAGLQAFGYLTLGGFIWCIGYMLNNYLKEN